MRNVPSRALFFLQDLPIPSTNHTGTGEMYQGRTPPKGMKYVFQVPIGENGLGLPIAAGSAAWENSAPWELPKRNGLYRC